MNIVGVNGANDCEAKNKDFIAITGDASCKEVSRDYEGNQVELLLNEVAKLVERISQESNKRNESVNSPVSDHVETNEISEDIVVNFPPGGAEVMVKDNSIVSSTQVCVKVDKVLDIIGNNNNDCKKYDIEEEVTVAQDNECIKDQCIVYNNCIIDKRRSS